MADHTTPDSNDTPDWFDHVKRLLTDPQGAQLEVTDHNGTTVYRQPLARQTHYEPDEEKPDAAFIRIRQIIGTGPGFDINDCRPRRLPAPGTITSDGAVFTLPQGTATISPAVDDQHTAIHAWDTFYATHLTAEQREDLDWVREDSWWG